MHKLKEKWGITSSFQFILILMVFAVNGSLSVFLAKPVLDFINIHKESTHPLLFWPIRIVLIFVMYQITLVIVGTLFGQKEFFWNMEKKMLKRLGLGRIIK
jgi:hypothetical protein